MPNTTKPRTAFITGGASGIGLTITKHLISKNYHVFIADRNTNCAKDVCTALNANHSTPVAHFFEADVSSWASQLRAFNEAIATIGNRIDLVAAVAGIGERKWVPWKGEGVSDEFKEPDLSVLDVDLKGLMYTVALAVQQFRRQGVDEQGFQGKIIAMASVCGFYAVPTLPIYTAAKHGVVGLTRAYGAFLPSENVTFNAICPNIVRTSISTQAFYDKVEKEGLLVPMQGILDAVDEILGGEGSGECYECGPKGGFVKREVAEALDDESRRSCGMLTERALALFGPL